MPIIKSKYFDYFIAFIFCFVGSAQRVFSALLSLFKHSVITALVLCLTAFSCYGQQNIGLNLSEQEQLWVQEHSQVTLAFDGYFPPYSFLNDEQQLEGFSVDLFKLLADKTGLNFTVHTEYKWDSIYRSAKQHKLDIVATMVKNSERLQWFNFTQAYIHKSQVIISRIEDQTINSKKDLKNKTVALVTGYNYTDKIVKEFASLKPIYFDTMIEALNAVSIGEADAAITFFGAGHYLRNKYLLTNLKYAAIYDKNNVNEHIAVRNNLPKLRSILDKALSSITEAQFQKLRRKWLPIDDLQELTEINLTAKELKWIKAHPTIRLGVDPEYAPFEYIDANQYKGMASDYIKLLNQRLKLNMQVSKGLSWNQVVNKTKNNEIDVLPVVSMTDQRSKFLSYTSPYLNFYRVIVTKTDAPFISSLEDLNNKIVAAQRNTSHYEFLIANSDVQPQMYDDLKQSLLAVSSGKADAYVGNIAAVTYWIRKLNLTNLKISAPASTHVQQLHFGVRKDWPELVSILQKGLNSISPRQQKIISEKWLSIDYAPAIDYRLIWQVISVIALLVFAVAIWNFILNRKVKLRTSQLIYSANYDQLTDLPNRFLTLDRLQQKIDDAKGDDYQIAVVSIYINDFKSINTAYGEHAGDTILHDFAQRLKGSMRENQQIGRLNSTKFLMIQSNIRDFLASASLAEQILACSDKAFTSEHKDISLNLSLGITLYPDDGADAQLLLQHADAATQHARKQNSGGYIYYTERLNHNISRQLSVEKHLRRAIKRNEFEVYYQPKLDPKTQKTVSFEALLRWNSEVLGSVSPVEFIPIAEKYDIINEIGLFVIQKALSALKIWQTKYAVEFSMAINLSPVQFHDEDLLPNIEALLSKYQLNHSTIEFEITEGVLLSKLSGIEEKLRKLELLGVSLAMDDFGTGYSSLSYLRKYRFDTLKIDKEFIAELPHSHADNKLVPAIIAMAHELDMKVVAEGVETEQQRSYLIEHKCDFVQGWLFSKALRMQEIDLYLDKQFCATKSQHQDSELLSDTR
jgi:diguanylate cyclase (GGDEF)-like protein